MKSKSVDLKREFEISKQYLNLPIKNGVSKIVVGILCDGKVEHTFWIELTDGDADWWASLDVGKWKGKTISLVAFNPLEGSDPLKLIEQSDSIRDGENLYMEKLRPQFHFSSRRGWLNDPNGLIFYKNEYHLYYQHDPFSLSPGSRHWAHAVSRDMVHWEEHGDVLLPNRTGECFSGAAFIDKDNLLGKKNGNEDVLVMFYLRTDTGLCFAYSNDRGYTMTDYEGNPVLTHEGARIDTPRPFWFEPTKRWIAPTYDFFHDRDGKMFRCVGFYSSANLKDWTYESRVEQPDGNLDELCGCVDFFQLPLDGESTNKQWVMIMVDGSYIVGTFDGHVFYNLAGRSATTEDRDGSLVVRGNYYATMTWENMPNNRRVQIAWMNGPTFPGMLFNQQMTVPSELTLHSTPKGPRLHMNPIRELDALRIKTDEWTDVLLENGQNPLSKIRGDLFDLEVEFEPLTDSETVFDMRGIKVLYDNKTHFLSIGDKKTELKPIHGAIRLRILLDRASIEVYGNDGCVYIPHVEFPAEDNLSLTAMSRANAVKIKYIRVHQMKSIWK